MEIERNAFLSPFGPGAGKRLIDASVRRSYGPGARIFEEGDGPDGVFLVLEGEVELSKGTGRGHRVVLARVGPGGFFGEMGVIDRAVRSAAAYTAGPAELALIPPEALLEVLRGEPSEVSLYFLRRVSERLRESNARFIKEVLRKERLQLVGEMADGIIHDFKNPMTSITLCAEIIRAKSGGGEIAEYCDLMEAQVKRMAAMAGELLDFSRGTASVKLKNIWLRDLFAEFRRLNSDYLRDRKVNLSAETGDLSAALDKERFLRVLQNLVGNSVEAFGPEGGEVVLSARRDGGGGIRIGVRDNGPGVPGEIRDTLFDPFVTRGKKRGSGLGLAIAKMIVEAHGGDISLDGGGPGAAFTIRLPGTDDKEKGTTGAPE